jgi:amino acid permease
MSRQATKGLEKLPYEFAEIVVFVAYFEILGCSERLVGKGMATLLQQKQQNNTFFRNVLLKIQF